MHQLRKEGFERQAEALPRRLTRVIDQLISASQDRLLKLLRWRVWLYERLQPTEWQATLFWAAFVGFLGACAAMLFTACTEGVHKLLTGSQAGVVESMRLLPSWMVVVIPALGGMLAGLVMLLGQRLAPGKSSTDYMEAILIGSGRIPVRASLVKSAAALFSIGSGGSIGREGPLVQLSAVVSSSLGRWSGLTPPKQRLLVACGAAAGIASAYNAPIGGSFFVAEIILGTIAMESLGPLVVSAVAATVTIRAIVHAEPLYRVLNYRMSSHWEMGLFALLGVIIGTVAPWFLRSLRGAERGFIALHLPAIWRLSLGGLLVGGIAVFIPEVCGNGYTVVVRILRAEYIWPMLIVVLLSKWLATAFSFGSGAPGGVFTPSIFVGASSGFLFGTAAQTIFSGYAFDARVYALVGMGAFLSAVSHAPLMAIIMIFEMSLSYDIILPLMLCCVVAYFTAKNLEGDSLYSEALRKKVAAARPAESKPESRRVGQLLRQNPPTLLQNASFADIARMFLTHRLNNLYVVDEEEKFLGAVSLHDIKPYLQQPELAEIVIAADILHPDFPTVQPGDALGVGLQRFLGVTAERLPVIDLEGKLVGSLSKGDLLLTLSEERAGVT